MINEPGIYNLDDATYLADPVEGGSLSSSGAKLIIECPAKFNHRKLAGEQHTDYFDFGKAAHAALLGAGADVVVLDYADWRTKDAKAERDALRAEGKTPMLAKEWDVIQQMIAAARAHPPAGSLLALDGPCEQTIVWHDLIWRRAKLDKHVQLPNGRRVIIDYKTTTDASRSAFMNSSARYGYFMSAAWYIDAVRSQFGGDVAFVMIAQEKDPPYVTAAYELTESFRRIGEWRNERAVEIYQSCMATGVWPGYSDDIELLSAPRWLENEHEEQLDIEANQGGIAA